MNIVNILKSNNHPNLLLYNKLINNNFINYINKIYNINNYTICCENNIEFKKTNYFYYFKNINNKNFQNFKKTLNNIILTNNYFINKSKIIIIEKINLSELNQRIFKNIIEKNIFIKYIIITSNINKIITNLKSLFLTLYFKHTTENINIKNIIYNNNLYNDISNYLSELLSNKLNNNSFKNIKTLSYLLLLNNINIYHLIKIIIDYLIKNNYKIIKEFIQFSSEIDEYYKNNYLRLFYYEYVLIYSNKLVNDFTITINS